MIGYILAYVLIGTLFSTFFLAEFTNSEYVLIGMILVWPLYIIKVILWCLYKVAIATKNSIPKASAVPIAMLKVVKYTGQNLLWGHHGRDEKYERLM